MFQPISESHVLRNNGFAEVIGLIVELVQEFSVFIGFTIMLKYLSKYLKNLANINTGKYMFNKQVTSL